MTYSIAVSGHELDEAGERKLLEAVLKTVQKSGGELASFAFTGSEVNASDVEEAEAILSGEPR